MNRLIGKSKRWVYPSLVTSLLLGILFTYQNCGSGGGGSGSSSSGSSSSAVNQAFVGDYFIALDNTGSGGTDYYLELNIGADGSFEVSQAAFPNGILSTAYTQKNTGTYTISGNTINVTYNYETCNPMGQQAWRISGSSSDRLTLTDETGFGLMFYSFKSYGIPTWYSDQVFAISEDRSCTY